MKDILGTALLDYFRGNYSEDIVTETTISEADVLPLPYLFRTFEAMPPLEQCALQRCKGKVLDVGCGAGSHSLYLQEQGHTVTAIDRSPEAVQVARARGVRDVRLVSLNEFDEAPYDTLLLLMNGTGIFGTVAQVPPNLRKLRSLIGAGGQVLIDSSDLSYMYDRDEEGGFWVPADRYYGELEFTLEYKGAVSSPFPWLYLDRGLFAELCAASGFGFEVLFETEQQEYLVRLTPLR